MVGRGFAVGGALITRKGVVGGEIVFLGQDSSRETHHGRSGENRGSISIGRGTERSLGLE